MEQREKQVVKNSAILYVRLLFTMAISLYTSRVVLNVLGVDDFGIYTVVVGFISLFSILSDSLSNSISRFIAVALGKEDLDYQKRIFSTSVNILIFLALIIIVLLELLGFWFVNSKLNIPLERKPILNIIYQLAVVNFTLGIIRIAFSSLVIAHEHASFFAKISISEAVLKLIVAILISYTAFDRLVSYVFLLMIATAIITIWTIFYCVKYFAECRYKPAVDKCLLKQMFGFASWNLVGQGSRILNTQGVTVVLNLFCGVVVNAARGIAAQVDGATLQFTNNIMIAVSPQIMKSYSSGDYSYMTKLVCQGSKYSGFVTMLFLIPLLFETDTVLRVWLGVVPEYTAIFTRLSLVATLLLVMSSTLNYLMQATGKIKYFQIVYGLIMLANIPLSYIALKLGCSPVVVYVIYLILNLLLIYVHILFVKSNVVFSGVYYLEEVLLKVLLVFIFSSLIPFTITFLMDESVIRLLLVLITSTVSIAISTYTFGLNKEERVFVLSSAKNFTNKLINRN